MISFLNLIIIIIKIFLGMIQSVYYLVEKFRKQKNTRNITTTAYTV